MRISSVVDPEIVSSDEFEPDLTAMTFRSPSTAISTPSSAQRLSRLITTLNPRRATAKFPYVSFRQIPLVVHSADEPIWE